MSTKVRYFVFPVTPEQLLGQHRVGSYGEDSSTPQSEVRNALQLELLPSVQPDLFADVTFAVGFGK